MSSRPLTLADQFAQLKNQRSVLVGLLFLLVIVVFWIGIGLFSSQKKFAVPKAMRDLAKPLSPILDEETLSKIEQKRSFSPEELQEFTIYKIVVNEVSKQLRLVDIAYQEVPVGQTPTPEQLQQSESSELAIPESSAAATQSAVLDEAPVASGSAENPNNVTP